MFLNMISSLFMQCHAFNFQLRLINVNLKILIFVVKAISLLSLAKTTLEFRRLSNLQANLKPHLHY